MRNAAAGLLALLAQPAMAEITGASYEGPTDRYGHGVVPGGEYAALEIRIAPDRVLGATLPLAVYEDTAPRLADLDGDGSPEVVTVISYPDAGAAVRIWDEVEAADDPRGSTIAVVAETDPIGTRFRWLAIAGIADLDGDGRMEIAYVDRPHLARVLRVVEVGPDFDLREEASAGGHTNHRIGDPGIEGGIEDCGLGPEVLTADPGWSRIQGTRLVAGGRLETRDLGPYRGVLECPAQ